MRFVAKSAVAKSEVVLIFWEEKRFGRYYRCVAKSNVAKCEVDCIAKYSSIALAFVISNLHLYKSIVNIHDGL